MKRRGGKGKIKWERKRRRKRERKGKERCWGGGSVSEAAAVRA